MHVNKAKELAEKAGWNLVDYQKNIGMVSFTKEYGGHPARINIYLTKMTVATCINHPKKGKTQMFRKNITAEILKKIFENPRLHTARGYREKRHAI